MNKKMLCLIVGIVFNFLFILNAEAANHFVRQGATGSGTGNDWTNAYTSLPATLIRGDTYYIARGSYPGRTFNTPASGTLPIIIKGATAADHGGAAPGWSNSYSVSTADGGSQATWTSGVTFSTSYWEFDGVSGVTWDKNTANYGFKFNPVAYPITIANTSTAMSNVTIGHVTATAPSGDIEKIFIRTNNSTKNVTNVTIHHCLTSGWANFWWATSPGLTMDNWISEKNTILQQWGSSSHHGESINNNYSNMRGLIVKHTWFEGYASTGVTGVIVANNNNIQSPQIYGNVFKNVYGSNGVITGTSAGTMISPKIYNNTFIQADKGGSWIGTNVTGAIIQNNILYNMSAAGRGGDYNAYFSVTNAPSEPHGLIASGSPFINEPANDLRLKAPIAAGALLPAPYNVDAFENTLETGGSWDRGALQYVPSGTAPAPITIEPPSNLRL